MGWSGLAKKGQVNTLDFMISVLVYAVMLIFLIGFWYLSIAEISGMVEQDRMDSAAVTISDMLIKTPGLPDDWEDGPENVWALGLARDQNVLSREKLANFSALGYNESRELMGLDGDFYFYVEDLDGDRLYEAGKAELGDKVTPVLRFGVLEGEIVRVEVFVHG
jgi:hypothetical protein